MKVQVFLMSFFVGLFLSGWLGMLSGYDYTATTVVILMGMAGLVLTQRLIKNA